MSTDDAIKISVNIEIPLSFQQLNSLPPRVSVTAPVRPLIVNNVAITTPGAYPGTTARMKNSNDTICVAGTYTNSPDYVWVNIYTWPAYAPPLNPSSVSTKQEATMDGSGNWILNNVSVSPNTSYQVAAWGDWGGTYVLAYNRFMTDGGGPYTDCTYPDDMLFQRRLASMKPMTSFDVVPVAWQLKTKGFAGAGVAEFNGAWTLHLVKSLEQRVLYCNGGDAVSAPRIQLSCQSPFAPSWELSFEFSGKRVCYSRPAAQFDSQARNSFQSVQTNGLDDLAGIPAVISVQPA